MRKILIYFLSLMTLVSCSKNINVFKTGIIFSHGYCDTILFEKSTVYYILDADIDGKRRRLIFDTGADFLMLPNENTKSKKFFYVKDANGNISSFRINHIQSLTLSRTNFSDLYSVNGNFPLPLLCFADGLIGNNVFKSSNLLIEQKQMVLSDKPFDIVNNRLTLDIFYFGANRLHSNIILNDSHIDTCLIDYGGNFDIELPISFYMENKSTIKPNSIFEQISTSYGINGISAPDTITQVNCNINFNGIQIDSVIINFREKSENRIGFKFLKRFEKIAINNSNNKIVFGELVDYTKSVESLYSFDWIDKLFVVSRTLNDTNIATIKIGEQFVEINDIKSNSINNYCDFLTWRDSLAFYDELTLKTIENKTVKIIYRR